MNPWLLGCVLFIKDVTFVFGDGREEGEYIIKCTLKLRNGAFALCTTRDKGNVQSAVCLDSFGKLLIEIVCRVGKGSEDEYLPVVLVDRMGKLLLQIFYQHLQLAVMGWRNIFQHQEQISSPTDIIHIPESETSYLFSFLVDERNSFVDVSRDALQGEAEGVDRTFQSFQQVGCHQIPQSLLSSVNRQAASLIVDGIAVSGAIVQIERWGVDRQVQIVQFCGNVPEVDGIADIGEFRTTGDRGQTMWKFTDGTGIIILHDVAARTGDGHGIQQLEEIVAQVVEQPFRCAFFCLQFCPVVIYLLGIRKDIIYVLA